MMINTLMCVGLLHVLKTEYLSSHIATTLFCLLTFADLGLFFALLRALNSKFDTEFVEMSTHRRVGT